MCPARNATILKENCLPGGTSSAVDRRFNAAPEPRAVGKWSSSRILEPQGVIF